MSGTSTKTTRGQANVQAAQSASELQLQQEPSKPEQSQPQQVPMTVQLLASILSELKQLNENIADLKSLPGIVVDLHQLTSTTGEIRDLLFDRPYQIEEEEAESSLLNKSFYPKEGDQAGDTDDDAFIGDSEGDEGEEDEEVSEPGTEPQLQRRAAQPAPHTQDHTPSLPWGLRPLDLPRVQRRTRERGGQV